MLVNIAYVVCIHKIIRNECNNSKVVINNQPCLLNFLFMNDKNDKSNN
jgi:hypothetical protein